MTLGRILQISYDNEQMKCIDDCMRTHHPPITKYSDFIKTAVRFYIRYRDDLILSECRRDNGR